MPALKAENHSDEKQTDIGAVAIEISSLPNFLGQMKEKLYSQGGLIYSFSSRNLPFDY